MTTTVWLRSPRFDVALQLGAAVGVLPPLLIHAALDAERARTLLPLAALIWFAARGEWRRPAVLVLTVAALATPSFVAEPALWGSWLRFLTSHSGDGVGRLVQIPLGLLLAVFAARTDRRWLLAVAWWLTMPMASILAVQSLVALAPMVRLHRSGVSALPGTPPRVLDGLPAR